MGVTRHVWVGVAIWPRPTETHPDDLNFELVAASNDRAAVWRSLEEGLWEEGTMFSVLASELVGQGREIPTPDANTTFQAIIRLCSGDSPRVIGTLEIVALLPSDELADSFLAECTARTRREVHVAAPCPVRMSWLH